jgi:hypothetical protein
MAKRKISQYERELLQLLLQQTFPGCEQLQAQMSGVSVEQVDDEGSIRFVDVSGERAPVVRRIPIEAEAADSDGIIIHALLHVVDGMLHELELYKEDGSQVSARPAVSEWHVHSWDS